MKIRNGFVSNSSSSSFCIYGASIDVSLTKAEEDAVKDGDTDEAMEKKMDAFREKLDKSKHLEYHEDYDNDAFYVGRNWSTIGDDETGRQFKESVKKEIEEIVGEPVSCDTIEETISC